MATGDATPADGALNAAIANEIGKLVADFSGRGASKSRAFIDHDVVVCLLEDDATKAEINLAAAGRSDLVRVARDALQHAMEGQLVAAVERLARARDSVSASARGKRDPEPSDHDASSTSTIRGP